MSSYKTQTAEINGQRVRIGDVVGFKSDVEQYGEIEMITIDRYRGVIFILKNDEGFEGDYIRGMKRTEVGADDCWL